MFALTASGWLSSGGQRNGGMIRDEPAFELGAAMSGPAGQ